MPLTGADEGIFDVIDVLSHVSANISHAGTLCDSYGVKCPLYHRISSSSIHCRMGVPH